MWQATKLQTVQQQGYRPDDQRVQFLTEADIFLFSTAWEFTWGCHLLSIQRVLEALSLGVKQPDYVTDHKSQLVPRVRKHNAILPPAHDFMPWCLFKHRKNLNLTSF
jgi:hypothetical protein